MPRERPEEMFWEDMSKKAEWFYGTRGRLSDEELNHKWRRAVAHVESLRESRTRDLDPGVGPLHESFALVGGGRGTKATIVETPYAIASDGFVSEAVEVRGAPPGKALYLKVRPRRGVAGDFDLSSAMIFVYDEKLRQWNLVERSGYSRRGRYLWALVHHDGVYAGIALPSDKEAARRLVLERFAYYHIEYGVEAGIYARADDYFRDRRAFREVARQLHELGSSREHQARLRELVSFQRETLTLRRDWRRQLPNGGLPEWQLLDYFAAFDRAALNRAGLVDISERLPWLFRLSNRVGRWYPNGPWNVTGRTKSLAIDPVETSVLYAGAANGGVWKTENGGDTWRHLWTFEDSMAVGAIALGRPGIRRRLRGGPVPATIYAATGEDTPGYGPSYGGVGIYKSTDDGASWAQKSDAYELGDRCTRLQLHPLAPDVWGAFTRFRVWDREVGRRVVRPSR